MYLVKIKGEDYPREVSDESGARLLTMWIDFKNKPKSQQQDKVITVQNWTGSLSDIRNVEVRKEAKTQPDSNVEYAAYHKMKRAWTPEQKAKETGLIKLLHYGVTRKKLEEETKEFQDKVYNLQLEFFKLNPKRIYPDPIIFRPLYKGTETIVGSKIVEIVVMRDMREAKYSRD